MKRLRPHHILEGAIDRLAPGEPYIADCRNIDIASSVAALVRNAHPGLVAISLRPEAGGETIAAAEREARRRGARIIWLPMGKAVR